MPDSYNTCESMPSRRILKSHLSANMLPTEFWTKNPKTIYMTRDVKDAVLSRYHMYKGIHYWTGDLESFLDAFLADDLAYLPYWPHVFEYYALRNQPNIYFTSFETIKKDLKGNLRNICKFLETPYTEELLDEAVVYLSFDKMKNSKANRESKETFLKQLTKLGWKDPEFDFYRKGKVGSFKEELPEGYAEKIDAWSDIQLEKEGLTMEEILNFQKF